MQCGFAFLEAGSVRSKNATNILIKNLLDSSISAISYWVFGWSFAFGTPSNPFIGYGQWCSHQLTAHHEWFFQFVFAATASTIVSGAVAERCEFVAYAVYCSMLTGFVYPVVTHWAWAPNGWLNTLGYVDFAGSGVVHMTGGVCAIVGAIFLGPRIGRFAKKGDPPPKEIRGHSVPFAALGGFILIFGFFAFNGGSQLTISNPGDGIAVALAVKNTIISGAFAAFATLIPVRIRHKTWSLLDTLNGALTGMVAICASCNAVEPWSAAVIGVVAGGAYNMWAFLVEFVKIDDPLNAFAVHFGGGMWGVIASPIFDTRHGIIWYWSRGAFLKLAWNMIGGVSIFAWSGIIAIIMFALLKLCKLLRVTQQIELNGLDIVKHGEPAYPLSAYGHGWGPPWDELEAPSNASDAGMPDTGAAIRRKISENPVLRKISEHPQLDWHLKQQVEQREGIGNVPRRRPSLFPADPEPDRTYANHNVTGRSSIADSTANILTVNGSVPVAFEDGTNPPGTILPGYPVTQHPHLNPQHPYSRYNYGPYAY